MPTQQILHSIVDRSIVRFNFRIPAPHIVAARAYRMSASSGSGGGLPALFAAASNCSAAAAAAAAATSSQLNSPSSMNAPGIGLSATSTMISSAASNVVATGQEKTPLFRLAKLLSQTKNSSGSQMVLKDDAPRRLSWER